MVSHAQRRSLAIVGMSLMLVALLSSIAWITYKEHANKPAPGNTAAKRIQIDRPEQPSLVLERNAGGWHMSAPYSLAVNQQRIEPLLGALTPGSAAYDKQEVDLDSAGLTTPLAVVTIDNRETRLGTTDISGERRYAQQQDQVYLVPEWVLSLVNGGVTAFAELNIFMETIEAVTIDGVTPSDGQTDSDVITAWQSLTARQIVSFPLEDMAPIVRQSLLHMQFATGTKQEFDLITTDQYSILHDPDEAFAHVIDNADLPDNIMQLH